MITLSEKVNTRLQDFHGVWPTGEMFANWRPHVHLPAKDFRHFSIDVNELYGERQEEMHDWHIL